VILLLKGGPTGLLEGIWILIVAGLAGFASGAAYSVVRPLLKRLGRLGAYAAGWFCVAAYLVALLPILSSDDARSRDYFSFHDRVSIGFLIGASLLFGTILGHAFVEDAPSPRSPKRWIQRKQRVTSRVHPPAT
jgi:hypothetical protein